MTDFLAEADDDGRRLDVVLARRLGLSRARAAAAIEAGRVRVDGQPTRKAHRVAAGERVEFSPELEDRGGPAPTLPPIRYEDDDLMVVAKPAGLVVHPGAGHATDTLVDALRAAGVRLAIEGGADRPGIVHRLDRDTSGLMVVACTSVAYAGLTEAIRSRQALREYVTLVDGTTPERGRIDAPIGRDPRRRTRFAIVEAGRPAVTRFEVRALGSAGGRRLTLLTCRLDTGRTHQVRVHLSATGAPVVGDELYGGGLAGREVGLTRPFLHASRLAFPHPVSGKIIDVIEPLPDDLTKALERTGIPADAAGPQR